MRGAALAFLLGIVSLQQLPTLPQRHWAWALPLLLLLIRYQPRFRYPLWICCGLLWGLLLTPNLPRLPDAWHGTNVEVEGWIASIPKRNPRSLSFTFQVATQHPLLAGRLLDVSWWGDGRTPLPLLNVGERWRFNLRLKQPWGTLNPGGFDYERLLYTRHIVATATVQAQPQLLGTAERYPLHRYRQRIAASFAAHLPSNPYLGILTALTVGESSAISHEQWEVCRRTGIIHLISISGSHIGMVAGMVFALVWWSWARIPALALRCPSTTAAAGAALVSAGMYTLLSGLAVPAQRSFSMAAVALLAVMLKRPALPSRVLALALFAVLVVEPNAPLSIGFWLSFASVAVILFSTVGYWQPYAGKVAATVKLQMRISLALLPLTLLFFQQFPLLSPLANLIAIPWVGISVLPLSLLAALLTPYPALQSLVLHLAALCMEGLWWVLLKLDAWSLPLVLYRPEPPLWTLGLAVCGMGLCLAPRGVAGRWLAIPLCLPLLWPPATLPAPGGFYFTLLDVGEGLAAVVRTANHVLVYDTGGWHVAGDYGRKVLVPFLHYHGVRRVDVVIVSHADMQHSGGLRSLREALPVDSIYTGESMALDHAQLCNAGQTWEWDGVRFSILHPPPSGFVGNNASCVLKVTGSAGRVLLPGDIESSAEDTLLRHYPAELAAEILVAPHQGRRNFSTARFLEAVQPRYILFATGYRNRYGYPRPATLATYQASAATILDSSYQGALTWRIEAGHSLKPERYRATQRRYWMGETTLEAAH